MRPDMPPATLNARTNKSVRFEKVCMNNKKVRQRASRRHPWIDFFLLWLYLAIFRIRIIGQRDELFACQRPWIHLHVVCIHDWREWLTMFPVCGRVESSVFFLSIITGTAENVVCVFLFCFFFIVYIISKTATNLFMIENTYFMFLFSCSSQTIKNHWKYFACTEFISWAIWRYVRVLRWRRRSKNEQKKNM